MTTHERIPAIDFTKGFAIVGVLFVHMAFTSRFDAPTLASIETLRQIFGWCVLAFFFASGFLHRGKNPAIERWTDFAKKRARRLLVPCLAFSWAYKLALLAVASAGMLAAPPFRSPVTPIALLREAFTPAAPQFYFLVHLFIVAVAVHSLLRSRILEREIAPWLLAAILVQSYWLLPLDKPHGEELSHLPLYATAYLIGMLSAHPADRSHRARMERWAGAILLGASCVSIAVFRPQVLHVAIPVLLLQVAMRLPARIQSPCTFLGRHAGAIYAWHTPIVMPVLSVLLTKIPLTGWPLILAMTIATLGISLLLSSLVRPLDRLGLFRL